MKEVDSLQVELDKVEEEERAEIARLADTKLARIQKRKAKIKLQQREKRIKNVRKELEKAGKATQKASREVDKHIRKREEAFLARNKWQAEALGLNSKVALLSEIERNLRIKLEKLEGEGVEKPKEKTLEQHYEDDSSSLWGGRRTSDKYEDKDEEGEESITVDLKTYRQKK